jgi:uncharacterized phage protein (TIGR01671 family)
MEEQIKYRAWDKQGNRMITHEQDFIPLKVTSIGVLRLNPHHEEDLWNIIPSDSFVLMPSTGQKDKNGTEIYCGDIIKSERSGLRYKVVFEKGMYRGEQEPKTMAYVRPSDFVNQEIIGNIHEHPQLLNK